MSSLMAPLLISQSNSGFHNFLYLQDLGYPWGETIGAPCLGEGINAKLGNTLS